MAGNSSLQEKLKAGIEAARANDKASAQRLLRQVTTGDPRNEVAWMWLASVSDTVQERRACLEQVLRLNPNNSRARDALNQIASVTGKPVSSSIGAKASAPAARRPSAVVGGERQLSMPVIVIGVVVGLALVTAVIFAVVSSQAPAPINAATREAIAAALATSTLTPTVNPADYTATPFLGVIVTPENLRTLPPAFTPTFTAVATTTPLPSPTPFPISEFTLLFTGQSAADAQPALFLSRGDATQIEEIGSSGEGFSDAVYSPSGGRIAFVRTVTYTNAESAEVTAPELFVAPANNLGAARQVTQLGAATLSSPTWSPDGLQLVFVAGFEGDENLWYITEDGNNLRPLTTNPGVDKDPDWSPLGDLILYTSDQGNAPGSGLTEIFSITPDGETIEQITDANGSSYTPSWSPDGKMVTFASDRNGDGDIFTMAPDGQLPFLLTVDDGGAEDRYPVFIPNMSAIVFLSNRGDGETFQLYSVDLEGKAITFVGDPGRDIVKFSYGPELFSAAS